MQQLKNHDIGSIIHYPIPPHLSGAYLNSHGSCHLPVTAKLSQEILSLPIGPHLIKDQINRVAEVI